jgi:hypothetical protein
MSDTKSPCRTKDDCSLIPLTPPYFPCTCGKKNCDCKCHGPKKRAVKLEIPPDPDQFRTTNKDFHPKPNDYDQGEKYRPRDNLSTDPNILPLNTEQQREYTPKQVDRPKQQKPGPWKYGKPIDPKTINKDHYKSPSKDDYPERAQRPQGKIKSGPGDYHTTNRDTYVQPTPDQYQTGGVLLFYMV